MSDKYYIGTKYEKDKQLFPTVIKESSFNFSALSFSYCLTDILKLSADIGYFIDKSQTFAGGYNRLAEGIADASFGLTYRTFASKDNLFDITQTARISVPIGDFEQVYDNIQLPIDLQPSSGSYRYNLGISFAKRFEESKFSIISINSIEMSQAIETENTIHKYGNLYNLSLICNYPINSFLFGMFQVRGEIREKALTGTKNQKNQYSYLNASGGTLVYLSPQVIFNIYSDWLLSLQYNLPVYKNINSEQLSNSYSLSVNLSKSFSFRDDFAVNEGQKNTFSKISVKVSGNCEHCKERIEETVNKMNGVASSSWDSETQVVTIYYKDSLPNIDEIQKDLANVGHDTEKFKAKDEIYFELPKCCLYRNK
jgi:copper chaperone CopZ